MGQPPDRRGHRGRLPTPSRFHHASSRRSARRPRHRRRRRRRDEQRPESRLGALVGSHRRPQADRRARLHAVVAGAPVHRDHVDLGAGLPDSCGRSSGEGPARRATRRDARRVSHRPANAAACSDTTGRWIMRARPLVLCSQRSFSTSRRTITGCSSHSRSFPARSRSSRSLACPRTTLRVPIRSQNLPDVPTVEFPKPTEEDICGSLPSLRWGIHRTRFCCCSYRKPVCR